MTSISTLIRQAKKDGKITQTEARKIAAAARADHKVTSAERKQMNALLKSYHSDRFDPHARQTLKTAGANLVHSLRSAVKDGKIDDRERAKLHDLGFTDRMLRRAVGAAKKGTDGGAKLTNKEADAILSNRQLNGLRAGETREVFRQNGAGMEDSQLHLRVIKTSYGAYINQGGDVIRLTPKVNGGYLNGGGSDGDWSVQLAKNGDVIVKTRCADV